MIKDIFKVVFGLLIGILISITAFYYYELIVTKGLSFLLGAIMTIVGILSILLMSYYLLKDRIVVKYKNSNTGIDDYKFVNKVILGLSDAEAEKISDSIQKIISSRILFQSIGMLISLVVLIGGLIGTIILLEQNSLLNTQNVKLENQNSLIRNQNSLIEDQTDFLSTQTELFNVQNESIENQSKLLAAQNMAVQAQNSLNEREYNLSLYQQLKSQLADNNISSANAKLAFDRLRDMKKSGKVEEIGNVIELYEINLIDVDLIDDKITFIKFINSNISGRFKNVLVRNSSFIRTQLQRLEFEKVVFDNSYFENMGFLDYGLSIDNEQALRNLSINFDSFDFNLFGGVKFENCNFNGVSMRFLDLRKLVFEYESLNVSDIERGMFYGSIMSADKVNDVELIRILKNGGAIFDEVGKNSFIEALRKLMIESTGASKSGYERLIRIYESISL